MGISLQVRLAALSNLPIPERLGFLRKSILLSKINGYTLFASKDSIVYAGTINGMYLSTNYGDTWTKTSNAFSSTSISAITVIDKYIFVASGVGMFRSSDNGATWEKLTAGGSIASIGTTLFTGISAAFHAPPIMVRHGNQPAPVS